jgi:RNase P subunit RPR2
MTKNLFCPNCGEIGTGYLTKINSDGSIDTVGFELDGTIQPVFINRKSEIPKETREEMTRDFIRHDKYRHVNCQRCGDKMRFKTTKSER